MVEDLTHLSVHQWIRFAISDTNLPYRFPIFETSATALCDTTGMIWWDMGMILMDAALQHVQDCRSMSPQMLRIPDVLWASSAHMTGSHGQ